MTYKLIDIDNNEYTITLPNFRIEEEELKVDVNVIERSYKAGAVVSGEKRDKSKDLSFVFDTWKRTDATFRNYVNELIKWLRKAVKIQNVTTGVETDIALDKYSLKYEDGAVYRLASGDVVLKQLTPYWWDIVETTVSTTGSSLTNLLTIDVIGEIEIPFIVTITALEGITKFSIKNATSGEGILIQDLDFGINGLTIYLINMKEGTAELNGISREQNIKQGTGFFNFLPGVNQIEILADGQMVTEITYKNRYYI